MKTASTWHACFLTGLLLCIAGCALADRTLHTLPDLVFSNPRGCQFRLSSLDSDMQQCFGLNVRPGLLLLLAKRPDEEALVRQRALLKQVNAEQLSLLFILGIAEDTHAPAEGYRLQSDQVAPLLEGHRFRMMLIAPDGQVLLDSYLPVTARKIHAALGLPQP